MTDRNRQDWEDLAAVDPLWAVLSVADLKGGGWDVERFLATGEADVEAALSATAELGLPHRRERVLDFGCGVGRLARPFAMRFREYVGVDAAERMVEQARGLHADLSGCTFVAHGTQDLAPFDDGSFDLVYSSLVLQHLRSPEAVERYLAEFLRVVRADGVVAFQLPASLDLRRRIQPRRRVYRLLRTLGVAPTFLQRRLGLHPIRLLAVPEPEARAALERHGGKILRVDAEDDGGIHSRRYYATAAPR